MTDIDQENPYKFYLSIPRESNTPSAPSIERMPLHNDKGHSYRLQKITEVQTSLENEVKKRETLAKKYSRAARVVDNIDTVLITITMASGV